MILIVTLASCSREEPISKCANQGTVLFLDFTSHLKLVWPRASLDYIDSPSPVTLVQHWHSEFSHSGEPMCVMYVVPKHNISFDVSSSLCLTQCPANLFLLSLIVLESFKRWLYGSLFEMWFLQEMLSALQGVLVLWRKYKKRRVAM